MVSIMKRQGMNPYLPLNEYIPDGEPHVFGNRVYLFGSHDLENGNEFCELDYVSWSASVDDMTDWRYEGVIYKKEDDPFNEDRLPLYAPDVVQGKDGKYYLYYCVKFKDAIHIAVCDTPAGKYEYYGYVKYADGRVMCENQPYDPSVICTEEGNFLCFGFAPCMINIARYKTQDLRGGSVVQLEDDMMTIRTGPKIIIPSLKYGQGTSFEGNEYFEGPSIRKIDKTYYLVYSSAHTHQLCYATSDSPMDNFVFGGVIVSNGDVGYEGRSEEDKVASVGNNHGGLVEVNGQWYIFYHRHTSLNQYSRQACAEKIYIDENGHIPQVTITSSGMNPTPLSGDASYAAIHCCNLTNGHMGALSSLGRTNAEIDFPYITCANGERYITNIKNEDLIGYKYFNLFETGSIEVVYEADEPGILEIRTEMHGEAKACIQLQASKWWKTAETDSTFSENEQELYFVYKGSGSISLKTLHLKAKKI
ncbi:MAG: family 43 glycosylhydrolase [Lachnospiraceae bacterium]|nr:family 43 glycosylhydrolase [Lachnospiraceae bacterium]